MQDAIGDGDCALCCIVGAMQDRSDTELVWATDYDNSMILQEVFPSSSHLVGKNRRRVLWGIDPRPYHGTGCLWTRIP